MKSYQATELQIQVINAFTHINNVRGSYEDPLGKKRIAVCEKKYEIAGNSFHKVWEIGQKKSKALTDRMEISKGMKAGCDAVSECDDEWLMYGPKHHTHLGLHYQDIMRLCRITRVIMDKLKA